MLGSSTPDGLAPLSASGVFIFTAVICFLFVIWGIFNLVLLLRISEEGESPQISQRIRQITRKIFLASLDVYKLDLIISFVAMLIFFLVIMGALSGFDSFYECLAYLFGGLNSLLCGVGSIFVNRLTTSRILTSSRYSKYEAYNSARLASNFQTFFFFGWTIFWISVALILYQSENEDQLNKLQNITKITTSLICFAFGSATVSIGIKICHSIYHKAAEMSVQTLHLFQDRLRRNFRHPALLAKATGQYLNKECSHIIDSLTFLSAAIALATHAGALYVVGTDQQGEIIFQQSYHNIYLPIMAFIFSMIFIWISNLGFHLVLQPSDGQQIRTSFNLQRYSVTFFMIGFLALVSYLCLPAQFQISQLGAYVRHPYHAYLCLLLGLILCFLINLSSQIFTTHPFFVNTISKSCSTGSATSIIYGLSMGYLYNFIPTILIAGFGFLAYYWIGTFGVGLVAVGVILLLPTYLNFSITYSKLQNSSYLSYIANLDEQTINSLVDLSKCRKDFDPHIHTMLYGLLCYIGYEQFLIFANYTKMNDEISLNSPSIFLGVVLGAMFPYLFGGVLVRSVNRSFLAIAFDIKNQIEEIPSMQSGGIDADFLRTNNFFGFQCMLSLKRFILSLFYPFIILGIGTGPKPILGFLIGALISGIQLGISCGISGCLWLTVKKQINLGNIQDEDMNPIKNDSEWGKAAQVGYKVGQPLKDGVNQGLHLMLIYTGLLCCVFGPVFLKIHE